MCNTVVKIAICEDNDITRRLTVEMLRNISALNDFSYYEYTSGSALLDSDEAFDCDIILMDIQLSKDDDMNGFEVAKNLRDAGCKAKVIFITASPDHVYKSFEVKPFRYILKPTIFDEFEEAITSAINYLESSPAIKIKIDKSYVTIDIDDIIYFEADKRYINIRTEKQNYTVIDNLTNFEEMLSNRFFFRTHRTYIVNFRHIANINQQVIEMKNGECVLLSRYKKAMFEAAYNDFLKLNLK